MSMFTSGLDPLVPFCLGGGVGESLDFFGVSVGVLLMESSSPGRSSSESKLISFLG